MAEEPASAVAGRHCGTCTLCCKVFAIDELGKPEGRWCAHCVPGRGCGIHAGRPQACRDFFCLWLQDAALPEEWKPERAKFVLSVFPATGFVYAQVDPGAPQAWRREPYLSGLTGLAAELLPQGRHVVVFVNREATLIMPTGPLPLGPMSPEDGFVVRQTFSGGRPGYAAERVPRN